MGVTRLTRNSGVICLIETSVCLWVSSCSVSQSPSGPIPILTTPILATVPAYTAENFLVPPVYAVLKYQGSDSTVYSDYSDSILLKAYSDTKCTTAAKGTLTIPANPLSLSSGIAQFSTINFALPDAQEQLVYLGASLSSGGLSICGPAVAVLQHFNKPYGMLAVAAPNAAGLAATGTGIVNEGKGIAVDSSGRYVVAGTSKNSSGGTEVGVWRYLSSGSLDTTFAGTGFIHFGAPGSTTDGVAGGSGAAMAESVVELKIDSNGKYVILGTSAEAGTGGVETVVWRVSPDGTFDGSFGQAGVFRTGATGLTGRVSANTLSDRATAMALDSAGRWVVVGESKNIQGEIEAFAIRLSGAGVLDTSFGTSGVFRSAGAAGGKADRAFGLDLESTSTIWVVGSSEAAAGGVQMALWKISSSGTAVTSWGSGGGVLLSGVTGAAGAGGSSLSDIGKRVKVDSNGKLVVAGTSKNSLGGVELALWRAGSSGFDTSFSSSGSVHFSSSKGAAGATGAEVNEQVNSLFLDTTSKRYVVSGSSANASGGRQAVLWRVKVDGTLDAEFNTSGSVLSIATGISGDMLAATIQDQISYSVQDPVGTYVSVGKTKSASGNTQLGIWRHLSNGIPDF